MENELSWKQVMILISIIILVGLGMLLFEISMGEKFMETLQASTLGFLVGG